MFCIFSFCVFPAFTLLWADRVKPMLTGSLAIICGMLLLPALVLTWILVSCYIEFGWWTRCRERCISMWCTRSRTFEWLWSRWSLVRFNDHDVIQAMVTCVDGIGRFLYWSHEAIEIFDCSNFFLHRICCSANSVRSNAMAWLCHLFVSHSRFFDRHSRSRTYKRVEKWNAQCRRQFCISRLASNSHILHCQSCARVRLQSIFVGKQSNWWGHVFSVSPSFAGCVRPCPTCAEKCQIVCGASWMRRIFRVTHCFQFCIVELFRWTFL